MNSFLAPTIHQFGNGAGRFGQKSSQLCARSSASDRRVHCYTDPAVPQTFLDLETPVPDSLFRAVEQSIGGRMELRTLGMMPAKKATAPLAPAPAPAPVDSVITFAPTGPLSARDDQELIDGCIHISASSSSPQLLPPTCPTSHPSSSSTSAESIIIKTDLQKQPNAMATMTTTATAAHKIDQAVGWQQARPPPAVDHRKPNETSMNVDEIRKRFSESFGIKVSDPQPVKTSRASQVDGDKPTEKCDQRIVRPTCERPTSNPVPPVTKAGRGKNRNRGRRNDHPQPRASKWPEKREINRGDPKRWDRSPWSVSSDDAKQSAIGSDWANAGAAKNTSMLHDANGLADWDGNWAPPPVDWDNRPAFRDHQSADLIDKWMARTTGAMRNTTWAVPINDLVASDDSRYLFASSADNNDAEFKFVGEIAPRYWIPATIDTLPTESFWRWFVRSTKPSPVDDTDLIETPCWWANYDTSVQNSHFLHEPKQPDIAGIDPDEDDDQRLARENDYGSWRHAENRTALEMAKRERAKVRRRRNEEKAAKIAAAARKDKNSYCNRRVRPAFDIYIRHAQKTDIPRILTIYNSYVEFGCATPETERCTREQIESRFVDIKSRHLPFIVACERGRTIRGRRRVEDIVIPDKVVGFAFADDYNDMRGMYRFTAEIEFFTDAAHGRQGVSKCLLDKLLALLDPTYLERGGYSSKEDDLIAAKPTRPIRSIMLNFACAKSKTEKLEWMTRYLEEYMGFQRLTVIEGMGSKGGESINLAMFQRRTGAEIDDANPPPMLEYKAVPKE